jgi:RimJ/RimL family protein N-acetyltransferase
MDRLPRQLRFANGKDSDFILATHNDPSVRAVSFSTEAIPAHQHILWMREQFASPKCLLLIAMEGPERQGVVRVDARGESAEVSLALIPSARGRGMGCEMLKAVTNQAQVIFPGKPITARVKPGNGAAFRTFRKAGYRLVKQDDATMYLQWRGE